MIVFQDDPIRVEIDAGEMVGAYARHRRRFASEVASLEEDALASPSRCTEWSVADVLRHCRDVDGWMQAIWSGSRPPFSRFDPNTTPHEFVVAGRSVPDVEVRDRYVESAEMMAVDVGDSGPERWATKSISPLGFVPWWLSALHVFYDSWLHERDVLLPLGLTPPVHGDEAVPVLAYSLAIVGTLIAELTDEEVAGVRLVTGDGPVISSPVKPESDTERLIDALSGRGTVEEALPGAKPELVERLGALSRFFHSSA